MLELPKVAREVPMVNLFYPWTEPSSRNSAQSLYCHLTPNCVHLFTVDLHPIKCKADVSAKMSSVWTSQIEHPSHGSRWPPGPLPAGTLSLGGRRHLRGSWLFLAGCLAVGGRKAENGPAESHFASLSVELPAADCLAHTRGSLDQNQPMTVCQLL